MERPNTASAQGLLPRIRHLDGVRGLAISMVLVFHSFVIPFETWWLEGISRLFDYGWLGVDLFFVLSGFLVTWMLYELRSHASPLREFYRRRALRILPAYFLVLGAALLVYQPILSSFGLAGTPPNPWWFLLAGQNYLYASGNVDNWEGLRHFWSLAVEIHLYLLWPFIALRRSPRAIALVSLFLITLVMLSKNILLAATPDDWHFTYFSSLTRIDAFAAGAFAAGTFLSPEKPRRPHPLLLLGFLCSVWLAIYAIEIGRLGTHATVVALTPAASVAFGGLLIWVTDPRSARAPALALLDSRPLVMLGKYSYGMYLLHYVAAPDLRTVATSLATAYSVSLSAALTTAGIVLCVLAWCFARLMYQHIEEPFLRMRASRPSPDQSQTTPGHAVQ